MVFPVIKPRRQCFLLQDTISWFFLPDTISLARAQEDYNAPDCRFINVKKGQWIYVYSKLVKENEAGEFWAGSVRRDYLKYLDICCP